MIGSDVLSRALVAEDGVCMYVGSDRLGSACRKGWCLYV